MMQLGETEVTLAVLREVAQGVSNEVVRLKAVEGMMQLGETEVALAVLGEVAQGGPDYGIRLKAVEGLAQIGSIAIPELFRLAWESPIDDDLGLHATMNLIKLLSKSDN
jgi:hypothetical protein